MGAPRMVYADQQGNIYDHPGLAMAGSSAGQWQMVDETQCIPLPPGSELFLLPGRRPVGADNKGNFTVVEEDPDKPGTFVTAVAAFMAPAHTATLSAAYRTFKGAPALPLFAYAAVGFDQGQFVVTGLRVDPLPRQDIEQMPPDSRIATQARKLMARYEHNRLWQHLGKCALTYCCPAARNLMLGRWEAPLPTSPACNAHCLGCLSSQPEGRFPATQDRLTFTPTVTEVVEVAAHHLQNGRDPLVSFGQGCEGEPLLQADLLAESIDRLHSMFPKATINVNTNGSLPEVVQRLRRAGLSSIRVSLNSLLASRHQVYYQPQNWSLEQAIASIKVMKSLGGFVSINLLCLPGVNDRPEEAEALYKLVESTGLDMIQWRNLNIDPEVYLAELNLGPVEKALGLARLMKELKARFPKLRQGYYNPKL